MIDIVTIFEQEDSFLAFLYTWTKQKILIKSKSLNDLVFDLSCIVHENYAVCIQGPQIQFESENSQEFQKKAYFTWDMNKALTSVFGDKLYDDDLFFQQATYNGSQVFRKCIISSVDQLIQQGPMPIQSCNCVFCIGFTVENEKVMALKYKLESCKWIHALQNNNGDIINLGLVSKKQVEFPSFNKTLIIVPCEDADSFNVIRLNGMKYQSSQIYFTCKKSKLQDLALFVQQEISHNRQIIGIIKEMRRDPGLVKLLSHNNIDKYTLSSWLYVVFNMQFYAQSWMQMSMRWTKEEDGGINFVIDDLIDSMQCKYGFFLNIKWVTYERLVKVIISIMFRLKNLIDLTKVQDLEQLNTLPYTTECEKKKIILIENEISEEVFMNQTLEYLAQIPKQRYKSYLFNKEQRSAIQTILTSSIIQCNCIRE